MCIRDRAVHAHNDAKDLDEELGFDDGHGDGGVRVMRVCDGENGSRRPPEARLQAAEDRTGATVAASAAATGATVAASAAAHVAAGTPGRSRRTKSCLDSFVERQRTTVNICGRRPQRPGGGALRRAFGNKFTGQLEKKASGAARGSNSAAISSQRNNR